MWVPRPAPSSISYGSKRGTGFRDLDVTAAELARLGWTAAAPVSSRWLITREERLVARPMMISGHPEKSRLADVSGCVVVQQPTPSAASRTLGPGSIPY